MLRTHTPNPSPASVASTLEALLTRIVGEYREMPGLTLTPLQAQRLWRLDEATCRITLELLVDRGFLTRTDRGQYARAQ